MACSATFTSSFNGRLTLADLTAIDAGQTPAVKAGAAAKPKPAKRAAPAAPAAGPPLFGNLRKKT